MPKMQRDGTNNGMYGVQRERVEPHSQQDVREMWWEWLRVSGERAKRSMMRGVLAGLSSGLAWGAAAYINLQRVWATRLTFGAVAVISAFQVTDAIRQHRELKRMRRELDEQIERHIEEYKAHLEAIAPDDPVGVAGAVLKFREELTRMTP